MLVLGPFLGFSPLVRSRLLEYNLYLYIVNIFIATSLTISKVTKYNEILKSLGSVAEPKNILRVDQTRCSCRATGPRSRR